MSAGGVVHRVTDIIQDVAGRVRGVAVRAASAMAGRPLQLGARSGASLFPACIVHLIRNSMNFASGKDRKPITQALCSVSRAEMPEEWGALARRG
ncbi:hypothetical protein EAH87_00140 [Sphingomonas koreensis]|nr:hypothetical protein EAH87_00140 [Sphingomonas koreensis]